MTSSTRCEPGITAAAPLCSEPGDRTGAPRLTSAQLEGFLSEFS